MGAVVEQRKMKKKKKTKRGPNKWMPFRRSTEGEKSVLPKSAEKKKKDTKEKSKKTKNKSFLESSDDEKDVVEETANIEAEAVEGGGEVKSKEFLESSSDEDEAVNDENLDPEDKENQPLKPVSAEKPVVVKP